MESSDGSHKGKEGTGAHRSAGDHLKGGCESQKLGSLQINNLRVERRRVSGESSAFRVAVLNSYLRNLRNLWISRVLIASETKCKDSSTD
jgi:hypothetical protein